MCADAGVCQLPQVAGYTPEFGVRDELVFAGCALEVGFGWLCSGSSLVPFVVVVVLSAGSSVWGCGVGCSSDLGVVRVVRWWQRLGVG